MRHALKVLVTGATGFIGSHLVEALLRRGDQVRCLIRRTSRLEWLKDLPVERVYGDCNDKASLKDAVLDVQQIFHCAGVTKATQDRNYFEVNATGTENLIRSCLDHNPPLQKFIYLSSQAAAGPCQNGQGKKESDACQPVSSYGRSKRLGEEFALAHAHELPVVILRPSVVYGPRERDMFAFVKLLSRGINPRFSGQEQRLSLCYVQDVVDAILLASEINDPKGDIFFVSDGKDYRLEEIGDIFTQAMGVKAIRVPVPRWIIMGFASLSEAWGRLSRKPALVNRGKVEEMVQEKWVCDISRARSLLCFKPRFPLEEGARLTVDWYRKENWL